MIALRTVPPTAAAIALLMVLQGLLLAGFIPFGLAAFAFPPLRYPAIAIGLLSLAGLAAQHSLPARGLFTCDSF
jgi:hypothetical protein